MKPKTIWYPSLGMLLHEQPKVSSSMDAIKTVINDNSLEKARTLSKHQVTTRSVNFLGFSADMQTRGRGTCQSQWLSPSGNLHYTIAIPDQWVHGSRLSDGVRLFPILNSLCLFETTKALLSRFLRTHSVEDRTCVHKIKVKWPNDILYKRKKLAGTLIEQFGEWYLIGIGVNIRQAPKVMDGGRKTTSFAKICKKHPTAVREHQLKFIRREFIRNYAKCLRNSLKFPEHEKLPFYSPQQMLQFFETHLAKNIVYRERQGGKTYRPIGIDADGSLIAHDLQRGNVLNLTSTYPF